MTTFVSCVFLILIHHGSTQYQNYQRYKGPKILTESKFYEAEVGRSIELECEVSSLGQMNGVLLWKQGARVLTAGKLMVRNDQRLELNQNNLILKKLTEDDAGDYECEFESNRENPVSIRHNLTILYPPSVIPSSQSRELSVNEGSSTTLECNVRGNPTPKVTWTREGKVIGHGPRLDLVNLNQSSGGQYMCTATNGIPQLKERSTAHIAHVAIEVLFSPRVTTRKHKVLGGVGTTVELTCSVLAQPAASLRWLKNNRQVITAEPGIRSIFNNDTFHRLVIYNMGEVDFGEYTCEAKNNRGVGRTHIHISGNPEKPLIQNRVERPRPGIFKLFWSVNTHKKITECTVFHRSRRNAEWKTEKFHNPKKLKDGTFPIILRGLVEQEYYEVQVDATNFFGTSELSDIFSFYSHPDDYYTTLPPESYFSFFQTNSAKKTSLKTCFMFTSLLVLASYL